MLFGSQKNRFDSRQMQRRASQKSRCRVFLQRTLFVGGLFLVGFIFLTATATTHAAATKPDVATERSTRTAPNLEINIPGVEFTDKIEGESVKEGTLFHVPFLAQYINGVYKYSLGVGTLIAIVTIMFAGFRWMTSFGNTETISKSHQMMGNAAVGLGLLFSVYVVLYFINPKMTELNPLTILAPKQEIFPMENEDLASVYEAPTGPAAPSGPTNQSKDAIESCMLKHFDPRTFAKTQNYDDRKNKRLFVKDTSVATKISWPGGHSFYVNKAAAPQFQAVADEIKKIPNLDLNKIWDNFSGGWAVKRTQNKTNVEKNRDIAFVDLPTSAISNHSFGFAADIAPKTNTMLSTKCSSGKKYPCMDPVKRNLPDEVVYAFIHQGCKWGGMFTSNKDRHHFDCLGPCASYTLPASFKLPPNE